MNAPLFRQPTRRAAMGLLTALTLTAYATPLTAANLAETLAQTPSLSTLNSLVVKAGLQDALKSEGPFTIFAPSNDAFKAVPTKTWDELAQNPDKLKNLLSYHIVPGKLMTASVKNSSVKTVQGAPIAISKAGDFVTIENAAVVAVDIEASNGVIQVIDTVMTAPAK